MQNKLQKIVVIVGPTAVGKSDMAVKIAKEKYEATGKESCIISADSRQIYKYLDVGTGKITKEETQNIAHFGLDICEPEYESDLAYKKFTTGDWLKYTENKIQEIIKQNKLPIICGGTGLYIDALLYGLTDNPAPNYDFKKEYEDKDLEYVQNKIKEINSEFFENLNNSEKNNRERLIRKLEILLQNNNKINTDHKKDLLYDAKVIIMDAENEVLENNIKIRCEKRWENMLLETKELIENKKVDKEWLSTAGLEYSAIIKYFDGKIKDEESCKDYIIQKSLQYAKRQKLWNRKYKSLCTT